MKTSLLTDDYRRTVISAEPGEYDGRPLLPELIVDAIPSTINRFRAAVSCALPFLTYTNGEIDTPTPLFPLTANKLRELALFDAHPTNIEWAPSDIPSGRGVLRLEAEQNPLETPANMELSNPEVTLLTILRSDIFSGSLSTTHSCIASSNVWLMKQLEDSDRYLLSVIAIGVLFAQDFDARTLQIRTSARFQRIRLPLLANTLESVGLKLEMV